MKQLKIVFSIVFAFTSAQFYACRAQTPGMSQGRVVYAFRSIKMGSMICADDVESKKIDQAKIPAKSAGSPIVVVGFKTLYPISKGQIISAADRNCSKLTAAELTRAKLELQIARKKWHSPLDLSCRGLEFAHRRDILHGPISITKANCIEVVSCNENGVEINSIAKSEQDFSRALEWLKENCRDRLANPLPAGYSSSYVIRVFCLTRSWRDLLAEIEVSRENLGPKYAEKLAQLLKLIRAKNAANR